MTGSDSPMTGRDNFMTGSISPMTGSDSPMTGRDSPMTGSDSHMTGRDNHMTGSDSHMTGRDNHMTGSDSPMTGRDNPMTGSDSHMCLAYLLVVHSFSAVTVEFGCHIFFRPFVATKTRWRVKLGHPIVRQLHVHTTPTQRGVAGGAVWLQVPH